jgi:signal transduction histidine kinase
VERLRRREAEAAQARELRASRSRIVAAADDARRRLERDLHDGAQQRFVSAALMVQLARRRAADVPEVAAALQDVAREIESGLSDLRELAHGIHPAVLSDRGLPAALESLAARSPLPVTLEGGLAERPVAAVETALYFAAAEALQNVTKYADATEITIALGEARGEITIAVRDDGRGGASLERGSGLRGLVDRLGAVGGRLELESPPSGGTTLRAVVPRDGGQAAADSGSGRPGVAASSALRA